MQWTHALAAACALACVAACAQTTPSLPAARAGISLVLPSRGDVPADIRPVVERVDQLLADGWRATGITPTPRADDATFLRRASLDLAGVIPTVEHALGEGQARAAMIDRLLGSDDHVRHFTNYWDDVLMGGIPRRRVDRPAFRQWLYAELEQGTRYDALVRKLITAHGVNSEGGRPDPTEWEPSADNGAAQGVNGAVNWLLRGVERPQDLAGATSRIFLGVQIQCAECHDHPSETWTQDDFRRFTASFMRIDGHRIDRGPVMGIRRVAIDETPAGDFRMRRRERRTGYGGEPPTALDGTSLDGDDPRAALAEWMTARDNPWFARAIVNRMWAYFLGRGFVEPIDDMRADAEVAAPEVLAALSRDFADNGYDLRRLMRIITLTEAYQRAPRAAGSDEGRLWSAFSLRPMSDTQLVDSIVAATRLGPIFEQVAGENVARLKLRLRKQFSFTFDVDEEGGADTFTGTVPQALLLMNGALLSTGSAALEGSTVGAACAMDDDAALTHLYLATLSRRPSDDERAHWRRFLAEAVDVPLRSHDGGGPPMQRVGARLQRRMRIDDVGPREHALEDIAWALFNSSEFFFIH